MIDFERLRQSMVDSQIRPNDVTDPRVIAAMLEMPRERFVPRVRADLAYLDDDLPVQDAKPGRPARYLIEPMVLARLLQALELSGNEQALDIGCATGYSAALLSRLARSVVAVEEGELAASARRTLSELGIPDVQVIDGGLENGAPDSGPFDAILLNGSVELVPASLLAQLTEGGRLVAVVRSGALGRATLYARNAGVVSTRPLFDAAVAPLPGFTAPKGFVF